jgi:transcriptional regulator with XRE-family HTH domain
VERAARASKTQPALSRLEAGGVIPTIPLLDRISAALDADLIIEIAPHAASG